MEYCNTSSERQYVSVQILDFSPNNDEKKIIAIGINLVFILCYMIHAAILTVTEIEVIEDSLLA